jgi:hypothetical protein
VTIPDTMTAIDRLHLRGDDRFSPTGGRVRHLPPGRHVTVVFTPGADAGELSPVSGPRPADDNAAAQVTITRRHEEGTPARALDEALKAVKTLLARP